MAYGSILGQTSPSIPSGVIVMWSGASNNIPSGWLLCDGSNNTPDLRNRFIVGAGSTYSVGATGGSDNVTLTTAQMPSHNHGFTGGSHTHSYSGTTSTFDGEEADLGSARVPYSYEQGSATSYYFMSYNYSGRVITNYANISVSGSADLTHSHTFSGTTASASTSGSISSTGSGQAHENRPPYYALCFIMKS